MLGGFCFGMIPPSPESQSEVKLDRNPNKERKPHGSHLYLGRKNWPQLYKTTSWSGWSCDASLSHASKLLPAGWRLKKPGVKNHPKPTHYLFFVPKSSFFVRAKGKTLHMWQYYNIIYIYMMNLDCLHKGRDEQTNHLKSSLHQLHEHFFKLLSVPKPRSQCFEITRRVDILLMEEILQELLQ